MKTRPSLYIVADRGHVIGYKTQDNNTLKRLDILDIEEGLQKLSEQYSDQAGSFPDTSTLGQGNSAGERMKLSTELELRAFRKIADEIKALCVEHQPEAWAFAAPSDINGAILDGLEPQWRENLSLNLKLDLTGTPPQRVAEHFAKARREQPALLA